MRFCSRNDALAVEMEFFYSLNIDTGVRATVAPGWGTGEEFSPSLVPVYTPPREFIHPLCVHSGKGRMDAASYRRLIAFITERLRPEELFRNQYGQFWLREATNRLIQEHQNSRTAAARPTPAQLARREQREAQQRPSEKYCAACGTKFTDASPSHHQRQCDACRMNRVRMTRERFCNTCGARFTAPESATMLCEAHRTSPAPSPTLT